MRQDQYEKLQALSERVMDSFLHEADPDHWPGKGLKIGEMDAQTRGDLYWVRKTAISAASLYGRIEAMIGRVQIAGSGTTPAAGEPPEGEAPPPDDLEAEMRMYAREAAQLVDQVQQGSRKKAAFDARTHGKP